MYELIRGETLSQECTLDKYWPKGISL